MEMTQFPTLCSILQLGLIVLYSTKQQRHSSHSAATNISPSYLVKEIIVLPPAFSHMTSS